MRGSAGNRRGTVLLITVALLSLLLILSVAFARLTGMEREAAGLATRSTHSRMAAVAGLEVAIGRLRLLVERSGHTSLYGEDPPSGPPSFDDWVPRDAGKVAYAVPVGTAEDPSFESSNTGISGTLPTPPGILGAELTFELRVLECQGQLNLNLDLDPTDDVLSRQRLGAMLDTLGLEIELLGYPDPVAGAVYGPYSGGEAIVAFRDQELGGTFLTRSELLRILDGPESFRALRDFVTVRSWLDETTLVPTPDPDPSPTLDVVVGPRFPINVNTAPRPVLVALLRDLRGYQRRWREDPDSDTRVEIYKAPPASDSMTLAEARALAAALELNRSLRSDHPTWTYEGPFRTWRQFQDFLGDLVDFAGRNSAVLEDVEPGAVTLLQNLTEAELGAVLANANPNSMLNRYHPDAVRLQSVDKADLSVWSTEFCFSSMGFYDIASLGALGDGDRIFACHRVEAIVRVASVHRVSTQLQFEGEKLEAFAVTSFPQPEPDDGEDDFAGDPFDVSRSMDGFIQALVEERIGKDGTTDEDPFNDPAPGNPYGAFRAPNDQDFEAASSFTGGGSTNSPFQLIPMGPSVAETRRDNTPLHLGGDHLRDGKRSTGMDPLLTAPYARIGGPEGAILGAFEFWIKPAVDLLDVPGAWFPVLHHHFEGLPGRDKPDGSDPGIGHLAQWISLYSEDGRLILEVRQIFATSDPPDDGDDDGDDDDDDDDGAVVDRFFPDIRTPDAWLPEDAPVDSERVYSPFDTAMSVHRFEIAWAAGEWHHVAFQWGKDGEVVALQAWVDGVDAWTTGGSVENFPTVVDDGAGGEFWRYFETYPYQGMGSLHTGDLWLTPGQGATREIKACPDLTVDGFKFHFVPETYDGPVIVPPPSRFGRWASIDPIWRGRIRLGSDSLTAFLAPREMRIATVAWTEWLPTGWADQVYDEDDFDVRVDVLTLDGHSWQEMGKNADRSPGDGSGSVVGIRTLGGGNEQPGDGRYRQGEGSGSMVHRPRRVPANETVEYRVRFLNPSALDSVNVAPVVDDLTFVLLVGYELLEWRDAGLE